MNLLTPLHRSRQAGSALLLTMLMTGVAMLTVAGVVTYSVGNARLDCRATQYQCAVAAAEAATEKVAGTISKDYLTGGEALVNANLATYRQSVPTASDSSYWGDWQFSDASGHSGRTFVSTGGTADYVVLNSTYAGLHGYASTYTLVSNARQTDDLQNVVGGVLQQLQLARIPIFQFAMYTSGDMEVSCGQPFTVTGRVHSNGQLYVEPDNLLTFQTDVTAVRAILFQRSPLDNRTSPVGSVVYQGQKTDHVPALTLPIGTSNTPTAIREIIEPPPPSESPGSPLGRLRYANQADMLVVATTSGTNTVLAGTSGLFNGDATLIPTNELKLFVSARSSFSDAREGKTVQPIDINIGALTAWSATNTTLRPALKGKDVTSIYVWDRRSLPGTALGAVRVYNGQVLPPLGLTVATGDPLYVQGNFNQYNSTNLGSANTATTRPASLVGDAITILSVNWSDANSTKPVASRMAGSTTVNAAILAGAVETAGGNYGGGMENFPRFLETWGSANVFTYNGSMVKMFPSLYATNVWGKANVYSPPTRHWAYDRNFEDPAKLPPLTPGLLRVVRGQWASVAPNQTSAPPSD